MFAGYLAALFLLALVAITLHVFGALDEIVTVGAVDGVAVLVLVWCVGKNESRLELSQTVLIAM